MAYKVIISIIVLACAYFAFETIRFKLLQNGATGAENEHVLGNPDGDVTLVKFLDYSCSYCRTAHPIIEQAIERDGNVRFIPRPVAVFDVGGLNAALLPYAAAKQGKFSEMHDAVMENYRVIDEQVLQDLALRVGIDPVQFKEDFKSEDVLKAAEKNLELFHSYRMEATPTYMIAPDILFSPEDNLSVQDFLTLFNEARGL